MESFLRVILNLTAAGILLFICIKLLSLVFNAATRAWLRASVRQKRIATLIFAALVLILPYMLSANAYVLRTVTMAMIYMVLALSLNIILGFAGQLSMGHAAFYGVGAYVTALLSVNFHVSFWIALPASAAVSSLFGLLLGLPTLRLKGDYLAITTIGFAEIVRLVLVNWIELTRGPAGIPGIAPPSILGFKMTSGPAAYYLILLFVICTVFISMRLRKSRLGRGLIAVRDDEVAAEAMGIKTVRLKVMAFVLGSALAGAAGSFFAAYIRYVNPDNFNYSQSVLILCMVVLGGIGSVPGTIAGAGILTALPEVLRDVSTYRYAIYGLLLIMMMIVRPQGMISETSLKGGDENAAAAGRRSFKDFWRPHCSKQS